MTDKTIPADVTPEDMAHARSYVQDFLDAMYAPDRTLAVARVLQAFLPPPPRPTLADMTREERQECRWMQADTETRGRAIIINGEWGAGHADLLDRWGKTFYLPHATVTPRPDLPRFTWPTDTPAPVAAPVPPSTLAVGSEWRDADALARACEESGRDQIVVLDRDGDAYVWRAYEGGWGTRAPMDGYEPYTIIRRGKEADQ